MDKEQSLDIVRAYLKAMRSAGFDVKAAFLFGSAARGTAGKDSDIDVALIIDGMANSFDAQVELMKLRRSVDLRLEPHPFPSQDVADPSDFLADIMENGIRVA